MPGGETFVNRLPWSAFWRNHDWKTVGLDFIQVATGLWGNVTYKFVLFAIEHDSRKVHLLGVTEHPTDEWLQNVVRSATMDGEPLSARKYWVHDNDGKFQTLPGILAARPPVGQHLGPCA